jgi:hypothetical protein
LGKNRKERISAKDGKEKDRRSGQCRIEHRCAVLTTEGRVERERETGRTLLSLPLRLVLRLLTVDKVESLGPVYRAKSSALLFLLAVEDIRVHTR